LTGTPRVSVVIPCYNYGHFLPACVDSVLDQSGVEVDVLIVDDASPDGSAAVAHKIAGADARVRVIAHETNKRHIATYNEGLAQVDGEYVVLLSADDLLAPGSLARSAALLRAHPEVGMVYGFSPGFASTPPVARTEVRSWSIWDGQDWVEQMCRRVSNPVSTPEVVLRTSLMRDLVGYDARVPHAADFLLWLRAAARGRVGRVNGADQAFYRKHGANMHVELYAGVHTDIVERLKTFEILFTEDAAYLPEGARLHELSRRALAREALVTVCQAYELGRESEPRERLVELAREICPEARYPELWQSYARQLARVERGESPLLPRKVSVLVDDLTGKVRWRRWRRSGLMGAVRSL
jgi:glycosyltransferase involved in cell wall biosynthesis